MVEETNETANVLSRFRVAARRCVTRGFFSQFLLLTDRILQPFAFRHFSQEGEDAILLRLLEERPSGFYVDVGAHHPKRFSNTFLFYQMGWRGINIEPSPGLGECFNRIRPRDINLEIGVGETPGVLTYFMFNDPALNTFDELLMREREALTEYSVVATRDVAVERLETIFEERLPENQTIDFMSIDVEGFDLQVLRSNDWNRFRPEFILVEALEFRVETANEHPIHVFMRSVGYELVAKTMNTLFYREAA
jgi:FkbM family methyltransferase